MKKEIWRNIRSFFFIRWILHHILYYFLKLFKVLVYQKNREILHGAYKNEGLHISNCPLHLSFTDTTKTKALHYPSCTVKKRKSCEGIALIIKYTTVYVRLTASSYMTKYWRISSYTLTHMWLSTRFLLNFLTPTVYEEFFAIFFFFFFF